LGSRFKVKMVLGAMGVSLLPVVFLFFFSYALVNRTLNLWFPRPLEVANQQSRTLLLHFEASEFDRLNRLAAAAVHNGAPDEAFLAASQGADMSWIVDSAGKVIASTDFARPSNAGPRSNSKASQASQPIAPESIQTIRSGAQV